MNYELRIAPRDPVAEGNDMVRRQAAEFLLEGAAESAHIGIAAGVADLCQGQVRVPHQQAGLLDPDRVDEAAEVGVHPLREEMGQVGGADAQGMGSALQGDLLKGVLGYVADDPVTQVPLAVVIHRAVGQVVQHRGQQHVEVCNAQGQVLLHGQPAQPVHRQPQVHAAFCRGQDRPLSFCSFGSRTEA